MAVPAIARAYYFGFEFRAEIHNRHPELFIEGKFCPDISGYLIRKPLGLGGFARALLGNYHEGDIALVLASDSAILESAQGFRFFKGYKPPVLGRRDLVRIFDRDLADELVEIVGETNRQMGVSFGVEIDPMICAPARKLV